MNLANFHHHYETIQRMLLCERTAREKIIYQPDRAHKLAEIDAALLALTAIKEELYQHSQPSAAKPATLLHLPGRN